MNTENAQTSVAARPDPASSLGSEAALAMAGFVAGSLSRHVKPLPLACALAVGGLAWRCLTKKRPDQPQPAAKPANFTSEEEFLRYFQEELAQQQVVVAPAIEKFQTVETMEEAAPLPLQTEEDFLRLFKAEMESAPALSLEAPTQAIAESEPLLMRTEEDFLRQFHADMAMTPEPPMQQPEPESMAIIAAAVEKTLASAEQPPEQVMAQNAAWLLGLEPLPMIQFEDAPPTQSMPAEIPDCIEIMVEPPAAPNHSPVTQRPSSRGLLGQMLEVEPVSLMNRVLTATPIAVPSLAEETEQPVMPVPAWLHAGMAMDSNPQPMTDTVVKMRQPEVSLIKPRRIVLRAPVTVPVDSDSKRRLHWWK